MSAIAKRGPASLPALADEIRAEHEAGEADAKSALVHYWNAGVMLLGGQEQCAHGEFLPFVESTGLSKSTAYRCMDLASNFPNVGSLPDLPMHKALAQFTKAKPKPKPVEAESEPLVLPDGEPDPEPVTGELVVEVLYDPKKGGLLEGVAEETEAVEGEAEECGWSGVSYLVTAGKPCPCCGQEVPKGWVVP